MKPSRERFLNDAGHLFPDNKLGVAAFTHALAHDSTNQGLTPEKAVQNAEEFIKKDMPAIGTTLNEAQTIFINEMLEAHTPGSPTYQQHDLIPKRVFV